MKKRLSLRALARALRVTLYAVQKAIAAGRITREPNGTWDVAKVRAQWRENTNHAKRHAGAPTLEEGKGQETGGETKLNGGSMASWNAARAVREGFQSKLLEIELRSKQGQLLDADEVGRAAFTIASRTRDKLLALPGKIGPELVGIEDPREITRRLRKELEQICDEIAEETPERNGSH